MNSENSDFVLRSFKGGTTTVLFTACFVQREGFLSLDHREIKAYVL